MTNLEVGDIVMCTVERIDGTIVFVRIEGDEQGSIILSEIAPGRIRNLRDYVVPKKKIICKVLRISGDQINLSLRRVTPKEQKQIREKYKLEKNYTSVLNTVLKENAKKIIQEIQKRENLYDFLQEAKEEIKELEKLTGKENAKKIIEIIKTHKHKESVLKKEFNLVSSKPNGIKLIKKILETKKEVEIKYITAGRYSIKSKAKDPKTANQNLKNTLEEIEKYAKKEGIDFSIKEK